MSESTQAASLFEQLTEELKTAKEVTITRDRYGYKIDGEFYRRVTTFCGGMPKPWLGGWAAKTVAEFAVEELETINALVEKGKKTDAIKLLKGSPWSKRDDAGDRGTAVHNTAEAIVRGQPVPEDLNDDERACAESVRRFLDARKSTVLASELTVFNPSVGYAGTLDLWEILDGSPQLLDWKTSKDVYVEHAIQLTAYRHAEFAVVQKKQVGDEEWTGRVVPWGPERAGLVHVVHITPDEAVLWPIKDELDKRLWTAFRAAAHVKLFQLDTDDFRGDPRVSVFGEPVRFPKPEPEPEESTEDTESTEASETETAPEREEMTV